MSAARSRRCAAASTAPPRGPVADDPQRAAAAHRGHRREKVGDALVVRDPARVEEVLAPGGRGGPERRVQAEAQRDRRHTAGVGARVDDRHHRVHTLVGTPVDAPQQRHVDRVRPGDAGRVERRRGVVDGDDAGAEAVRLAGDLGRAPERVVEDHDVRAHRSQRVLHRAGAERDPVAVGGGELERAQLVEPVAVALAAPRDHDVALDRSRPAGEPRLLVEVGPDAPAARAVEHRHVADDQGIPRDPRRAGADHAPKVWPLQAVCGYGVVTVGSGERSGA